MAAMSRIGRSETDFAREHVFKHHPVAHETVKWIFEGGGSIMLEEKMTHPGKAIADEGHEQEPGKRLGNETENHDGYHQQTADEVQLSAGPIAVFRQIIGIEFAK